MRKSQCRSLGMNAMVALRGAKLAALAAGSPSTTMRTMVLAIILLFERCANASSSYVLSLSTNVRP